MKILYVITSADHGGAQTYVLALAKHFGGKDLPHTSSTPPAQNDTGEVLIAAGSEHSWLFEQAAKHNIPTIKLRHLRRGISPLHDFLAIGELRRVINEQKPDLVHLNSSKAGFIGSLASKIPVIYTVHGFILNEQLNPLKRALYGFLERFGAKYRAYTITVSKADQAALQAAGVCRQKACSTIYNGPETIDFLGRAAARQQLNLPPEGHIVGTIANLYPNKGVDVLISAFAELKDTGWHLAIIGEGPSRPALEALIKKHNLTDSVTLLGSREHADRLLKAFDVFVLPSRKEGMPFALLAALQAGLPIVATNVGGVPEAVMHAGLMVPPEDPKKLAHALKHVMSHQEIRLHLGGLAKQHSAQFTQQKMLEKTKNIYDQVIHKS